MQKTLFIVISLLLAIPFIVSCGGAPNEKIPSVEKQLLLISRQVGLVFTDTQFKYKKVVEPEKIGSMSFFGSTVNHFLGHGFFVNPSNVVLTRHQYKLSPEEEDEKPKTEDWEVVEAQYYLSVPLRYKLYELEWLQTHGKKDFALFKAKETWSGFLFESSVQLNFLPIQELPLYQGELKEGDRAYILTTTGSMPRIKTGIFRNAMAQPPVTDGRYDIITIELQQSIMGMSESGSPVFIEKDGRIYLVGVVGSGTYDREGKRFAWYARITPSDLR